MKCIPLFFLCFCFACTSPDKIPDDIMGIDKMKVIVWDLMTAGEYAQLLHGTDSTLFKQKSIGNFQQVLDVHHLTNDEFYKSYTYYEQHPGKNKILLDSVAAYAGRKRNELYRKLHR